MAGAIVNTLVGDQWEADSAGPFPTGTVHPKAIQALAEIGIIHQSRSKRIDELRRSIFDLVITVCDSAAEECPLWLGQGGVVQHSFPDPAKSEDIGDFQKVRDAIKTKILPLPANYGQK